MTLTGHVDFRGLQDGTDTNLDLDGVTIFLEEGATVQMTDEQFAAFEAAGGTFAGPGTSLLVDQDLYNTIGDDLTDIRGLDELQLVTRDEELLNRHVTDPITLTFEQAELTTQHWYDADGDFGVLPVDDDGVFDEDGDPAEAGDFRESGGVTVEVSTDADLTGLLGVTTFDIVADEPVSLTLRADQLELGKLEDGEGGATAEDIIEVVNDIEVLVQVDSGNTDSGGDPIIEQRAFTISVERDGDGDVDSVDVTGNAAALAQTQNDGILGATLDAYMVEADTVTWEAVGTTATAKETGPLNAHDSAATVHTFEWIANADDVDGGTEITGFTAGAGDFADILDFSAFLGDGYDAVGDGSDAAVANDERDIVGSVAFFDGTDLTEADFTSGGGVGAFEDFAEGQAVVIGNNGNIWYVDSADTEVTNDDIKLVGTVDGTFGDFIADNVGA
ncbi:hypothetical protein QC758_19185, partial [Halomonas campisalis]